MGAYQPERGDLVVLDFSPQAGREQAGRRPALVLSPQAFNVATGRMFACPITNQIKGSPFEVVVPRGAKVTGAILSDQLRSVDWIARKADYIAPAPKDIVHDVLAKVRAILFAG